MTSITTTASDGNGDIEKRLLEEFGIQLGDCLGLAQDGFTAEYNGSQKGVALITLVAWTTREQVERIIYGPQTP